MNDLEIMDRQAKLIEEQKRLFINTVDQFKRDLTFLQGLTTMLAIEHKNEKYISKDAMIFLCDHLSEMQSMLNEFEFRMKDYE
jgi:hypothetical protein